MLDATPPFPVFGSSSSGYVDGRPVGWRLIFGPGEASGSALNVTCLSSPPIVSLMRRWIRTSLPASEVFTGGQGGAAYRQWLALPTRVANSPTRWSEMQLFALTEKVRNGNFLTRATFSHGNSKKLRCPLCIGQTKKTLYLIKTLGKTHTNQMRNGWYHEVNPKRRRETKRNARPAH